MVFSILIVEACAELRNSIAEVLRFEGYDVVTAVDVTEAMRHLDYRLPDLLLLEVDLRRTANLQLISAIRQRQGGNFVTIAVTSSDVRVGNSPEIALADIFLLKPVPPLDIIRLAKRIAANTTETRPSGDKIREDLSKSGRNIPNKENIPSTASRILVLDDNFDTLRLFNKTLTKEGYQVHLASNLQEARHLLDRYRFDTFVCDMQIGDENAIGLLRERLAVLKDYRTQVIVISAEEQMRFACEAIGIEFFMSKPVFPHTLANMINRLSALARK